MLGASFAEAKPLGEGTTSTGSSTPGTPPPSGPVSVGVELDSPSREFLRLIPYDFARRHLLLGLENAADGPARLAVASTTSPVAIFNVGVAMKRACASEQVDDVALAEAIDRAYASAAHDRDQGREQVREDDHSQGASVSSTPLTTLLEGDAAGLNSDAITLELSRTLDESRRDADLLDTAGKTAGGGGGGLFFF